MPEEEYGDIVTLLKSLCITLQPYANNRDINLCFSSAEEQIQFIFTANELVNSFSKLIISIIDYVPDKNTLYVNAAVIVMDYTKYVSIKIHNTGINLKLLTALLNKSNLPVTLFSSSFNETTFEVRYPLSPLILPGPVECGSLNEKLWNYKSVVNGIKSHFAKLNNPVARLEETKPKEAAFLININNCILKNIGNEQFDANALSTAMAMSRAQLLRRMKSATGNSPGYYIKTMRLQKAKELLETSAISISEAAFQTGFNSPSNFTKVFFEKYGSTPSQFLRPKRNATNE